MVVQGQEIDRLLVVEVVGFGPVVDQEVLPPAAVVESVAPSGEHLPELATVEMAVCAGDCVDHGAASLEPSAQG